MIIHFQTRTNFLSSILRREAGNLDFAQQPNQIDERRIFVGQGFLSQISKVRLGPIS